MFNLAPYINLPFIWSGLLAFAVFLYVFLDGFDLGVGILFPFAPSDRCRDRMMNSIAPFWDGNETWLVMGGMGLFAAFPLAYAILMPAIYMPIICMLLGLIFRAVAFEFRFQSTGVTRKFWDYSFHFGSLVATFMQGIILGTYIQGIHVHERHFVGDTFDWLSPFSIGIGIALIFGYVLLGATWLIMKSEDVLQQWSYKVASYALKFVGLFFVIVSLVTPLLHAPIYQRWFSHLHIFYLLPLPLLTLGIFVMLWRDLNRGKKEYRPFILSISLFLAAYIGLLISIWPWVIPFSVTFMQAAAAPEAQSLILIGTLIILPCVLSYTAYCYYIFRGKTSHESHY